MYRRSFLKFVAGSPLVFACPACNRLSSEGEFSVIAKAEEAIGVMDFEAAAQKALPPAHWGHLSTGTDDDATLRANREGFSRYQLRPRRLVDVSSIVLKTDLLGSSLEAPIVISPVGGQKMFHPDGEIATARAAQSRKTLQILSTVASSPVEDVTQARGGPIWFQLYIQGEWKDTLALVKRAESAGCPVLVLTVDTIAGRNPETFRRLRRLDSRDCVSCHGEDPSARSPIPSIPVSWDIVRKLKDSTRMKLVVKGIDTAEDAQLCIENGADGIVVSNHGGRGLETGRGTIECLSEVVKGVAGKIPILIDGGFRRGTDVFKALALGAKAICIGRPYVWGLAAFGQPGVERVLDILRAELQFTMRHCGTRSLEEITSNHVVEKERLMPSLPRP